MQPARVRLAILAVITVATIAFVATHPTTDTATSAGAIGTTAPSQGSGTSASKSDRSGGPADATTTTTTTTPSAPATPRVTAGTQLTKLTRITGSISPKSVVASGHGITFAQNMIYSHTVTVYGPDGTLKATIPDSVDLTAFGITGYPAGTVKGGPVEVAFTPDGTKAYVSNYEMYGAGFGHPGDDICDPRAGYDNSFVYRIDVATLQIDQVIEVGPVPKYVAVSPNGKWLLVSNWCGYDLSVVDIATAKETQRIPIGPYPRGIVIAPDSSTAYVAAMGGNVVRTIDLGTFAEGTLVGLPNPRHLVLSPDGRTLYATLNASGAVAAVDAATGTILSEVHTGAETRSMAISADGASLYVVNYDSSSITKLDAADLSIVQEVPTDPNPIGITYDPVTGVVWVACYGGSIELFQDGASAPA